MAEKSEVFVGVGGIVLHVPASQLPTLKARDAFVRKYCAERGWDPEHISIEQLLDIREQEGWKNPVVS
jgi:hypothetical protein